MGCQEVNYNNNNDYFVVVAITVAVNYCGHVKNTVVDLQLFSSVQLQLLPFTVLSIGQSDIILFVYLDVGQFACITTLFSKNEQQQHLNGYSSTEEQQRCNGVASQQATIFASNADYFNDQQQQQQAIKTTTVIGISELYE
ncbi:conserved hypothetical protein [Trichinella spiralis]|uniref:hypothetical protein n=1 Tax=Trichinella spiralis TaxID=6334 RepID=UPI0001EFD5B2|nr:conserved hypothetical protein [Trichinella spiralis]